MQRYANNKIFAELIEGIDKAGKIKWNKNAGEIFHLEINGVYWLICYSYLSCYWKLYSLIYFLLWQLDLNWQYNFKNYQSNFSLQKTYVHIKMNILIIPESLVKKNKKIRYIIIRTTKCKSKSVNSCRSFASLCFIN